MQQGFNQVTAFISQIITSIGNFLRLVWNWSFGQIVQMVQTPFSSLPIWKQVLFAIVIAALAYFVYRIVTDLLEALVKVFKAGVGLIMAIIELLQPVLIAGLIAFGGAWVIRNVNVPWLP